MRNVPLFADPEHQRGRIGEVEHRQMVRLREAGCRCTFPLPRPFDRRFGTDEHGDLTYEVVSHRLYCGLCMVVEPGHGEPGGVYDPAVHHGTHREEQT
jgi:hypothetical protein